METQAFTKEEYLQYSRQLRLPNFGLSAQQNLKEARVLVIGAGALGCSVLQYLTSVGVGNIGLLDFDIVELSNLHRQILYTYQDIGKPKVYCAKERLQQMNPHTHFQTFLIRLESENATSIFYDYDIIVDCSDNFETRYLVDRVCYSLEKPYVFGAIEKWEGRVGLCNYLMSDGLRSARYSDLHPEENDQSAFLNCAEAGVLGVICGIIGSFQATEVIKVITNQGKLLTNTLLIFDALRFESFQLKYKAIHPSERKGKAVQEINKETFQEITVHVLKEKLENRDDFQLIDVRKPFEQSICTIGGTLIESDLIEQNIHLINRDKPVVVYCHKGARSAKVSRMLRAQYGFHNIWNLTGGIDVWAKEIDKTMAQY